MRKLAKEEGALDKRRKRAAEKLRRRGEKVDEDSVADEMLAEDKVGFRGRFLAF